nr:MAG TPA: hypothetical protein [Caudoviricetes sp.]
MTCWQIKTLLLFMFCNLFLRLKLLIVFLL